MVNVSRTIPLYLNEYNYQESNHSESCNSFYIPNVKRGKLYWNFIFTFYSINIITFFFYDNINF